MQCISRISKFSSFYHSPLGKSISQTSSIITRTSQASANGILSLQQKRSFTGARDKSLKQEVSEENKKIVSDLNGIVERNYKIHPFSTDLNKDNLKKVLGTRRIF